MWGMNKGSSAEARKYLKLVDELPDASFGPLRKFTRPQDAAPLLSLGKRVTSAIRQIGAQTYEAPSAWHAAAWLLDVATIAAHMAQSDAATGLKAPFDVRYGGPMFRGHNNADHRLVPTIYRSDDQVADLCAMVLLLAALREIFEYEEARPYNTSWAHMAALQHHGAPTTLLDFSLDPRIAVYFACKGARRGARVVVHFIQHALLAGGEAIILPPPWVERLYVQRGVFALMDTEDKVLALESACLTIVFPADEEYVRAHAWVENKVPDQPWYRAAFKWARTRIADGAFVQTFVRDGVIDEAEFRRSIDVKSEVASLNAACGAIPFKWSHLTPAAFSDEPDDFTDMMQWLALKHFDGAMRYDVNSIDRLIGLNQPLFRAKEAAYRFLWNQFLRDMPEEKILAVPMLGALQAVAFCVNDWDDRNGRR